MKRKHVTAVSAVVRGRVLQLHSYTPQPNLFHRRSENGVYFTQDFIEADSIPIGKIKKLQENLRIFSADNPTSFCFAVET